MKEKTVSGFDYLWCALYACAGFALELLLLGLEGGLKAPTTAQRMAHLLMTAAAWTAAGLLVIFIGKKTTGFRILETKAKLAGWRYLAVALCFVVNAVVKYLDWGGFKPLLEFQRLGLPVFGFQYLYYAAEGFLISLVLVYAQKACETWFRNKALPYGGLLLGLTWGLAHIFSRGSLATGLLSALSGVLYGCAYLFVARDYRKALPIVTLLFLL